MGGIIMGALAGAGAQLADYADKDIAQTNALQRMSSESDLATQRAEALEQFKVQMANQQRTEMVQRVQGAAGNIADQQIAPVVQQEKAGIADPSSWTPEQQAAVDQSNGMQRQGLIQQAITDGSAGLATGDINPEKAMENTSKLQINSLKMQSLLDRANDHNTTLQEIAGVRAEAMKYGYELRLQAAEEKQRTGKIDTATGRMLITSEDANIHASTNMMMMIQRQMENEPRTVSGKPNPRLDDYRQQLSDLRDSIKQSQATKQGYLQSMGLLGAAGAHGTPAVGTSPYPEGTKLTGPDGKPYIVQGGQPVPLQ